MKFLESLVAQIGSLVLIFTSLERFIPREFVETITIYLQKLISIFNPYVEITFDEFPPENYGRSIAYEAIQAYLGTNFSGNAARLKGNVAGEARGKVALSMDDYQEIVEIHKGIKVSWVRNTSYPRNNVISFKESIDEKRSYILSFRQKDRDIVVGSYLSHVLEQGKAIRFDFTIYCIFMSFSLYLIFSFSFSNYLTICCVLCLCAIYIWAKSTIVKLKILL